MDFLDEADEEEPEVSSDPTPEGQDEDPFREPDEPDWTEDDAEFADDYWEDLFWADEIFWWSPVEDRLNPCNGRQPVIE
jgi:hypothetical protein